MTGPLAPVVLGAALGASFNPYAGVAGSALAAALVGSPRTARHRYSWAIAALMLAWLVGDGFRVLGRAREAFDAVALATPWERWAPIAFWALLGLAFYAIPAWLGAFVGRRVTHGTGWLSAVAISVTLSLALSQAAPVLVEAMKGLVRGAG